MKNRLYKTLLAIGIMPVMIGSCVVILATAISLPVIAFICPDKIKIREQDQ